MNRTRKKRGLWQIARGLGLLVVGLAISFFVLFVVELSEGDLTMKGSAIVWFGRVLAVYGFVRLLMGLYMVFTKKVVVPVGAES